MDNELLHDLEYKVLMLRKDCLNKVKCNDLTLKEVLDLGFNRTHILLDDSSGYVGVVDFYKDSQGDYFCEFDYFNNEEILNAKVKYNMSYDACGYLELYVIFVDEIMYDKLEDAIYKESTNENK